MADKYAVKHQSEKVVEKIGPSPYGSHASMIDVEESKIYASSTTTKPNLIVLKDESGLYLTEKKNLDTGVADPYRCMSKESRDKVFEDAKNRNIFDVFEIQYRLEAQELHRRTKAQKRADAAVPKG